MTLRTAQSTRVVEDLQRLAEIGADVGGGVTRLAFTREERAAHEFLARGMRAAGLQVWVDSFGTTYGLRPGRNRSLPAIAFGSHVDTVPHGGALDGALGSVAALEVMRRMREHGVETERPLLMVVFAAEEGARFGRPNLGARAITGELTRQDLASLRDAAGVTLETAMRAVGFQPEQLKAARWGGGGMSAFLELHIEQGQVLESEGTPIGLVEAIAGSTRLRFEIEGTAVHSGATPMPLRHDALVGAAELILEVEAAAKEASPITVSTVGRLQVEPNSITTIPGRTILFVDVRDVDAERQRTTAEHIVELSTRLERTRGLHVTWERVSETPPVGLPTWLRGITVRACEELDVSYRVMPSGAGHDTAVVASLVPAGMIFVPSRGGISHSPEEWTDPEDVAAGTEVLYRSVLLLDDALSKEKGS